MIPGRLHNLEKSLQPVREYDAGILVDLKVIHQEGKYRKNHADEKQNPGQRVKNTVCNLPFSETVKRFHEISRHDMKNAQPQTEEQNQHHIGGTHLAVSIIRHGRRQYLKRQRNPEKGAEYDAEQNRKQSAVENNAHQFFKAGILFDRQLSRQPRGK